MKSERQILTRKLTLEALKKYRGLFNKSPDDEAIELYADMLCEKFEFKQVTWALTEFVKKGSPFFPSCGEIFSLLTPPEEKKEELAPIIVAEMIKLIRAYGKYDEARMIMAASPNAKLAFRALGDTSDIRNSENFETTKAQLERLVKGVLASKENKSTTDQLQRIVEPKSDLQRIDYSGFLPDGGGAA
jgi:hypothetical protein